ncbi:MAG: hypothetical protein LUF68_00855 [Clostridiales bacterium]|nr:hypothetical protein [Clostridiales bacterium]
MCGGQGGGGTDVQGTVTFQLFYNPTLLDNFAELMKTAEKNFRIVSKPGAFLWKDMIREESKISKEKALKSDDFRAFCGCFAEFMQTSSF